MVLGTMQYVMLVLFTSTGSVGALLAICAQHEMDHLNGRLFIDYLSAVKRTMITSRMKKLKREKARA